LVRRISPGEEDRQRGGDEQKAQQSKPERRALPSDHDGEREIGGERANSTKPNSAQPR